jgi:two-component system sensor histidine kinase UhpB
MLKNLSLQARLCLFISTLIFAALIGSAAAVILFSPGQLDDEHEASVRLARQLVETLNQSLRPYPESTETVTSLMANLPTVRAGHMGFLLADAKNETESVPMTASGVPDWFSRLLTDGFTVERFPVLVAGRRVGDIIFSPDLSADIREKWIAFIAIIGSGIALGLISSGIAYATVSRTLRPLRVLETSLSRLQSGGYGTRVVCDGPPEIARSLKQLNTLSDTLHTLSTENRSLMRKIVTLQDEERMELARELHDELGPQLFAIRANAAVFDADDKSVSADAVQRLVDAVETLQETNRRILDRLRPMHIQELGLIRSLDGLVDNARSQASEIHFARCFDPSLDALDPLTAQTIYRVTQEALTNILRHAGATRTSASVRVEGATVHIEVSDNGRGFAENLIVGRGITGMRERVRALGGTFHLERRTDSTVVEAIVPIDVPEQDSITG